MGYLSPPPSPAPVIVHKDVGGLVSDYQAQTEIYRREGREVRLHECRSACTLALSLPNVCVYPDSLVKFHLAYNAIDRQTDAGVSDELFRSYPVAVQQRLGYLTRQYRVLTGNELISLGVRNCNGGDRTMIASAGRRRRPSTPAADRASPLGDLAETVRGAVAQAFGPSTPEPRGPIHVTVASRSGPSPRQAGVDPTPTASIAAPALADSPEPPRRPPSETLPSVEPPPARLLISGGLPILASGAFVPPPPTKIAQR